MKEQDAAHSFEKGVDIICEECKSEKAIHYANNKYFCSGCFAKEYTRLRSELQQKDEEIVRLLDQIEYQNKIAKEDHDKIKKLEFQISNCDSEFNLPNAAVFNLQQIALADDDMVKVPGAAEQYRFIARHILELFQKKQKLNN